MKKKLLFASLLIICAVSASAQQSPAEYRRYFISRYGRDGWRYDSTQKVAKRQWAIQDSIRKARIRRIQDSAIAANARTAPSTDELNRAVRERTKALYTNVVYYCPLQNAPTYHNTALCKALNGCGNSYKKTFINLAARTMKPCRYCH